MALLNVIDDYSVNPDMEFSDTVEVSLDLENILAETPRPVCFCNIISISRDAMIRNQISNIDLMLTLHHRIQGPDRKEKKNRKERNAKKNREKIPKKRGKEK